MNNSMASNGSSSLYEGASDSQHIYKLWTLAYVLIFYFICVLVCIVLWYHLWVKNLGGK